MNLRSMSIDKLSNLRNQIDAALAAKVAAERKTLEAELGKLTRLGPSRLPAGLRGGARGSVAPKYRNPADPAQTWAGRGLKPRWLAAAIKTGKKLEDFLIAGAVKATNAVKPAKASRRRKAPRKPAK